jgi:hypothetical protein
MTIVQELLEFSKSRPLWQQDLIRRICCQPELQSEDLDQALENLKGAHGVGEEQVLSPLREKHLSHRVTPLPTPVALASISNVKNANQLAPDQTLPFALKGITLIYGHNGTGKTGYTRIIKQLCRARSDKAEPLLGNAYKGSNQAAEADVAFLVSGSEETLHWIDGNAIPAALSQISVFDSSNAPLYADQQNEIEFLPFGLDVLPNLGRACQNLSSRIHAEINAINDRASEALPQPVAGTSAQDLIQRLSVDVTSEQLPSNEAIRSASSWDGEDEKRLKEIENELEKISMPAKAAAQYRRFKNSIDALNGVLENIESRLGPDPITASQIQIQKTREARDAADIAAKRRFDAEPLGASIGTPAWRNLYEIAEQFSSVVYPADPFPATGDNQVCLLCQQPFSESAAGRMERFRQFMQDTSQRQARAQEDRLREMDRNIFPITIPTARELNLTFAELRAVEPSFDQLRVGLENFVGAASAERDTASAILKGDAPVASIPRRDREVIASSKNYSASLEEKVRSFDAATGSADLGSDLKKQHDELLSRRQLNASQSALLARRAHIVKVDALHRCREQCDTVAISRKNSEFREKYITADFEKAVKKEIRSLGLQHLPLRIEAKTERGTSYVGVSLQKVVRARNAHILSEGEFRALALACFLAEVATIPTQNGIVVDDPVSSLDHQRIRQVALRLVEEAKIRSQVIIFTHDLSFYYELFSAAAVEQVPIFRNWMQYRAPGRFGVVEPDEGPWQVKKTKERIKVLNTMIMQIPEGRSPDEYAKSVSAFYMRLRETWERLVEECLLGGVVGRFQPGIQTQSLKRVSVTDEDYSVVFFNMKKVSELSGHDWAVDRECQPPSKLDMQKDLAILKAFEDKLVKRSNDLESKRKDLEQAPKAQILPNAVPKN